MPLHGFIESSDSPHSLWPDVVPCDENRNDSANTARLLYYYGDELVITLPGETDSHDAEAGIYGLTPTGMLSMRRAQALVDMAGKRYAADCKRVLGEHDPLYRRCLEHANQMRGRLAWGAVRKMMTAVVTGLQEGQRLPLGLVVTSEDEIDADLSCIGTPAGVLNLTTGHILPPDEARRKLIISSTGVEYQPEAQHPRVDEILPPIGPAMLQDPMGVYRAMILGYGLTHRPSRQFIWEICAAKSGKTTFINALKRGLGKNYVRTIRRAALRPDRFASSSSHDGDLRHLAKPTRLAFVRELQGKLDSEIVKAASGGDDMGMRRIRLEDEEIEVTAYLWFMGNPKMRNGPSLDIGDRDENSRAIEDRAKMLNRAPVPNPDGDVVTLRTPEFCLAALARLVEYTMACRVLEGFPPDELSSQEQLEAQRQSEMEDWQREWVPDVLRAGNHEDTGMPLACSTLVYESFERWWRQYGTGKELRRALVTQTVKSHYGAETDRRWCPIHKTTDHQYLGFVMAQPISLLPV